MDDDFIKSETERLKEETKWLKGMNTFLKWFIIISLVGFISLLCYIILSKK